MRPLLLHQKDSVDGKCGLALCLPIRHFIVVVQCTHDMDLFDTDFKIAADFEQLLRLIYINRIYIKYLPIDFVTMRTGGVSSSGIESHKKLLETTCLPTKKMAFIPIIF